jgi:purine-nucleoside phosphorylase
MTGTGVVERAADSVAGRLGGFEPRIAIVLGSGLGSLVDRVRDARHIPYSDVAGFPAAGVAGHKGEIVAGTIGGAPVVMQNGRFHAYEGHAPHVVGLPVRLFQRLGARTLILTNAAGAVRAAFRPGTLMLIADHINLTSRNPLIGPVELGEERFPDMSDPYDRGLRTLARDLAREAKIPLEEGVYAGVLGPSYETPAEIRMLQRLGADAVGMSTVPEVIVARARGMSCLGFSMIANMAAGLSSEHVSHEAVLAMGQRVAGQLGTLIEQVAERVGHNPSTGGRGGAGTK